VDILSLSDTWSEREEKLQTESDAEAVRVEDVPDNT